MVYAFRGEVIRNMAASPLELSDHSFWSKPTVILVGMHRQPMEKSMQGKELKPGVSGQHGLASHEGTILETAFQPPTYFQIPPTLAKFSNATS